MGPGKVGPKLRLVLASLVGKHRCKYETLGDYWIAGKAWHIRATQQKDWRHTLLILIHELIELALVLDRGIDIRAIDDFDRNFEKERANNEHGPDDEPGDDPRAPYHECHVKAMTGERLVAGLLDVNWQDYTEAL